MKFRTLTSASVAILLAACGGGSSDDSSANNSTGDSFVPGDTGDASSIMGGWYVVQPGDVFTHVNFFEDGTYTLIDPSGNLEWGTFSRNAAGQLSTQGTYDEEDTGFVGGADGETTIVMNREGDTLMGTFTDDEGTFEIPFQPISTDEFYGTWRSVDTSNQLDMLSVLADGTYSHARVDNDTSSATTGAEKGSFTYDDTTGELTVNVTFDGNGVAGLSSFSAPAKVFLQVAGDTLTVSVDTDGDGVNDEDFVYMQE